MFIERKQTSCLSKSKQSKEKIKKIKYTGKKNCSKTQNNTVLEAFEAALEMIMCQSAVATCAATLGLYVRGEWKGLKREMEESEAGTSLYFVWHCRFSLPAQQD